jgi:hypothetical protein
VSILTQKRTYRKLKCKTFSCSHFNVAVIAFVRCEETFVPDSTPADGYKRLGLDSFCTDVFKQIMTFYNMRLHPYRSSFVFRISKSLI